MRTENAQFNSQSSNFFILIFRVTREFSFLRTLHNKTVGVLYNKILSVLAVGKPEVVGSNPAVKHFFYSFLDTRKHILMF